MLRRIAFLIVALMSCAQAAAGETSYAPMAPFEPFAGRTLRGEGTGPDGAAVIDVAKHEFILGGRAFQSTHKLVDNPYGGRTIIFFDEGAEKYVFHYFTTGGFHTTGEIEITDNGFTAVEQVVGHPVFDEVHSTVTIDGDDIVVSSRHRKMDGTWSDGEGFVYRDAPEMTVDFD